VKSRSVGGGTGKSASGRPRRRIIQTVGPRFKRDGIDGSRIATLMSDAGLTNGAFYANFASKEDLVATTVARPATRTAREFSARCARPRRS
jgi:TetR/AcrR family transcriptional regulator, transcriptional repressor for nem operon